MAKKITLYIGSWLILFAIMIYPIFAWINSTAEPDYEYISTYETQPRVYVTDYGEKYHNSSCHYLLSRNAKGLTEARNAGYTACSYCHGTPSGTIEVEHRERVEIDSTNRNIGYSIGIALIVALFPALLISHWVEVQYLTKETTSAPPPDDDLVDDSVDEPLIEEQKPLTERDRLYKWYSEMNEYQVDMLINRHVIHDEFGEGYITRITDRKEIQVWFEDLKDFKYFTFPDDLADKVLYFYR